MKVISKHDTSSAKNDEHPTDRQKRRQSVFALQNVQRTHKDDAVLMNRLSLPICGSTGLHRLSAWHVSQELMQHMKDLKETPSREEPNSITHRGCLARGTREFKCSCCKQSQSWDSLGSSRGASGLVAGRCGEGTHLGPLRLHSCNCSTGSVWDSAPSHEMLMGEVFCPEIEPQ